MSKYNVFLTLFIISIVSLILFLVFYFQAIFGLVFSAGNMNRLDANPFEVFRQIFSPGVVISFIVMILSGLANRILGIVLVARNKFVSDGEKALWIIGFILLGFITGIIFLILAKGKKYADG